MLSPRRPEFHGDKMRRNLHSSSPPPPPRPLHSSSPAAASPTVTTLSSRSPSPSAPAADSHEHSSDLPPRSASPPRSPSPSKSLSNASTMGSRPGGLTDNERPPTLFTPQQLQLQLQRPQLLSSSASAPPGRLPRLLPADVTSYADGTVPEAAMTTSGVSLVEFASVIQLQGYQEQRRAHSRLRLHRWLVSSALSARLLHCSELAHRTLVDCFRSDDKKSFASLYNAVHDVRNSCDATRRYALLEPDLDLTKSRKEKDGLEKQPVPTFSNFMHEIPVKIRDDLLDFISELRTNPDFLATRIMNLSQQELAAMTSFRPALDPIDAVMAMQVRGKAVGTALQKAQHPQGPSAVERLLSFQRHDPLSALIYTIFANSSGPDSAEDLRRTDVWATTCARLITESKTGYEKFVKSVLDAWAGMREWPGKANLELYLMQVLQDGQFLLDKPDDQPARQTTKDTIAADDFYDAAVKKLFEVIDDEPHAGGIPEGVLEIGNAILRKLDDSRKHRAQAQFLIVSRWFFSTYLLSAIIHPETQGIMMGHHISEHARQKILKEIGIRAQRQVLDMTLNWKQAAPVLPEIRQHIENILNRFKHRRSPSKPILHPAKAITSPRETVEVQPFIVLCPSDIVTLVNTLFPERRPQSSHSDLQRVSGLASGGSSISGVSLPFRTPSNSGGDASSILSMSASSMTSDTTSREPLLDGSGRTIDPRPEILGVDMLEKPKVTPTEEYGRRLRMACSEMTRILGHDVSAGTCHPCAENWAVLHVSADGKELKTRMRKDAEVDDEEDEDSPDTDDSEDEGPVERLDLESDYHQIKEAIAKLVKDYEIPPELVSMNESKGFSNRTASNRKDLRGYVRATVNEQLGSKNPYLKDTQSQISNMIASQRPVPVKTRSPQHVRSNSNPSEIRETIPLIAMLEAAYKQCFSQLDYVNSHLYYKTLQQLKKVQAPSLTRNGYSSLLNYFIRGPRDSLGRAARAIEEFEAWFVWLKQSQERHDTTIEETMLGLKSLRDKMWYITDVRNSAGYEEAKNVAMALKIMGQPTKTPDGKPVQTHKPRQFSKSASNNFLLKTEAQTLDIMAAPVEFAGPNKLADEQSTMTTHWLTQFGIENFCKGEERIHRFCLEIDRAVNRLVGDGIIDGPVLWSSELYRRDKEVLDSGRQKGDLFLTSVGTVSIPGDEEYEMHSPRPGSKGLDFPHRPSLGSLRSINRMGSQQSFDSGKWSGSRPMDLMDSLDHFGGSSPVLTIDTSTTFWSPFQTQAHSASSATSTRPRTMSSSKGTAVLHRSDMVNDDKRRFLLDLKQTLTGLLLSDLGAMVFGHGSETDSWFSSDLGEECIQRKEEEDRKRKRLLAKKKSMRSLKSARPEHKSGPLDALGRPERSSPAAPVATLHHAAPDNHSAGEYSTSSSDATARSSISAAKRAVHDFPYSMAFRRLLRKFAAHPNPFSKLHALYELEMLIVASLTSRSGRQINRRDTLPTVPQSPTLGSVPEFSDREPSAPLSRAQNLEEAIANCEERRSHSMQQQNSANGTASPVPFRTGSGTGTRSPVGPPSTDMIVDVLQGLFRDADIRPKSLFRDLQYIASFVPASMLDKTARGKAFWDAGLAALGLKQDVCRVMVEIADEIIQLNTQNRGLNVAQHAQAAQNGSIVPSTAAALNAAAGTAPGAVPTTTAAPTTAAGIPADDPLAKFTMEDAAKMLLITAKEGDAVAERELAIFYLTHPDLVTRTVLPLTKPREVFRQELLQREQSKRSSGKSGKDDWAVGKADPVTMCVAQHWMEMSKKGGDQLAIKYLRARDEMERIP